MKKSMNQASLEALSFKAFVLGLQNEARQRNSSRVSLCFKEGGKYLEERIIMCSIDLIGG